jgi:diaminohydroxyphosphoribosylaminopyrimidine deaminase/5-amino-6-(5-phosphoribosylamino)uracil reductase
VLFVFMKCPRLSGRGIAVEDRFFMARAIELSKQGLGQTFPNPIVGAVVVSRSGEIIGEGFHSGGDHAEVVALSDCASRGIPSAEATIYVSLEPCNHRGKRPPCTQAIVEAGIARVVFAVHDPNPIAMGGGEYLRSHGLQVSARILEDESAFENRAWIHKITRGRPYITWKIASTFDGFSAAADGTSMWITSEESRSLVQMLRAESDAILIGTGTALADDPSLIPKGDARRPLRIVMGQRKLPQEAILNDSQAQTLFLSSHESETLIAKVNQLGLNSILVEAGPTLGTALLLEDLIDEIHWFQAPTLLGTGRKSIGDLQIKTLSQRRNFVITKSEMIGPDHHTLLIPKSEAHI